MTGIGPAASALQEQLDRSEIHKTHEKYRSCLVRRDHAGIPISPIAHEQISVGGLRRHLLKAIIRP